MHRKVFLALVAVGCLCATAYANPTITMGFHTLLPDKAGQLVTIYVSGDDLVSDVNLAMSIDDPTNAGPLIESVDLYVATGLVFNLNNSGVQGEGVVLPDSNSYSGITTLSGTVVAGNGSGGQKALAIVEIDTSGFFAGSGPWVFLASIPSFELGSDFAAAGFPSPILVAGQLSIVPEPSSIVLGVFAAAGLCAVAIRRRRKKSA